MFRIVLVLLLLYLVWLLLFLLYERKRRKKGAPQKEPCQMVREAEIIGKSRFKISHSTPQVRSYPKGEAEAKRLLHLPSKTDKNHRKSRMNSPT